MRKLILILAYSLPLFAGGGNSLISAAANRNAGSIPNTATYQTVSTFCLEGQVDGVTFPGGVTLAGIYGQGWNTTLVPTRVMVNAASDLFVYGPSTSEGTNVNIAGWNAFRWQFERNGDTGYTFKAWNEETGETAEDTGTVLTTGPWDWRNSDFHFGAADATADSIIGNIGFVRMHLGTQCDFTEPPQRLLSSGYANGADWEFESNLTDNSGNSISAPTYSVGSATYQATENLGPAYSGDIVQSAKVGTAATLDSCASFGNQDTNVVTVTWAQTAGVSGTLGNITSCSAATFTPGGFGTATLEITVTDTAMVTGGDEIDMGGFISDAQGRIDVLAESGSATIANIIGPLIASESNPWAWKTNRDYYEADLWLTRNMTLFQPIWENAPGTGTVDVIANSFTLTFSSDAQVTFCGGMGNTTVDPDTSVVIVEYSSPLISGQTGHATYRVSGCPTQFTVTIGAAADGWWQTGTLTGLTYTVATSDSLTEWVFNNQPANYYDNVLAFYSIYYATGLTRYQTAARQLAERFFIGPNWDLGYNNDFVGGNTHYVAGPARGAAVTGLVIWAEEDTSLAYDPWDGIAPLWDLWGFFVDYGVATTMGLGDAREMGYMTDGLSLCARYEPDAGVKAQCVIDLNTAVDDIWEAYETTAPGMGGHWVQPATLGATVFAGSGMSVSVLDGDETVTCNSCTWSSSTFTCYDPAVAFSCWVWFIYDPNDIYLSGNDASATGEPIAYKVASVTDSTHLELTAAHNSGMCAMACTYGMYAGPVPGLGMPPYMLGVAMGGMGTHVYDYYVSAGDTTRATTVKNMVADGMAWVVSNGIDTTSDSLWYYAGFIQCSAAGTIGDPCTSDVSLNAEAIRGFSADYLLNRSPATLAAGDELYHRLWGKPGYAAPYAPGDYLDALDDYADGGYMNTDGAIYNKWLGFIFGYGSGQQWPAARLSGESSASFSGTVKFTGIPSIRN